MNLSTADEGEPARRRLDADKRVVVVGRFPPPLDGQAIATRRLARLLELDFEVQRVDISTGETVLAESDVRLRAGRIAHYLRARKRLRTTLAESPDATVLWAGVSGSVLGHYRDRLVTLPSFKRSQKVFAVVHWGNLHELFPRVTTGWSARRMISKIAGVVFLDELLRDRCSPWIPGEKALIIPNTIEESILLSQDELDSKRLARRDRTTLNLLYVGSMTATKGWADVVKTARILSENQVPVRLDLVGRWESDEDRAAYSDYIVRHGLGNVVKHHGGVSDRTVVKEFYGQADAFLLPTYYSTEAQPLTVIEAMNAGTPVITTKHAGLPGMLDDRVEGYFVPPRDPEAIAAAVEQLRPFNRWHTMSISARRRFERQFHPDVVREKWTSIVKEV